MTHQQFEIISTVMYEPLSYVHTDYHPLATSQDDPLWQKLTNRLLIEKYHLETEIDCDIETDSIAKTLFTHWALLPECAQFLGYIYDPKFILKNKDYYQLSSSLKAFLSLRPVLNLAKIDDIKLDIPSPTCLGYHLLFIFIESVSTALAQRFKLCFSPNITMAISSINIPLSRSLFLLVLSYVTLSA